MKRLTQLSILALALAVVAFFGVNTPASAQNAGHGAGFVDENGDGYNDNAPDADGDGIPNGMDDDYVPTNPENSKRNGFIDEDGDGINDRLQDADGDGIPNCEDPDWVKPEDGTGSKFGQQGGKMGKGGKRLGGGSGTGTGTGDCDGTGPKGTKQARSSK